MAGLLQTFINRFNELKKKANRPISAKGIGKRKEIPRPQIAQKSKPQAKIAIPMPRPTPAPPKPTISQKPIVSPRPLARRIGTSRIDLSQPKKLASSLITLGKQNIQKSKEKTIAFNRAMLTDPKLQSPEQQRLVREGLSNIVPVGGIKIIGKGLAGKAPSQIGKLRGFLDQIKQRVGGLKERVLGKKLLPTQPIRPTTSQILGELPSYKDSIQKGTQEVNRELDPVKKIIGALKEAKPVRKQQEFLYTKARGEKIARAIAVGQRTTGEKGFFSQLGQLKGELPKAEYESIRTKVTQEDIDSLFNIAKQSPKVDEWEKISAGQGLIKILGKEGGQVPTEGEIKLLNRIFGKEFTDTIMAKRSTWKKITDIAGQALNLPRSLMASIDLSAPLRQGVFLIGRPKQFIPAFVSMFKQAGSEKAFRAVQDEIFRRPTYPKMRQYKLALTDLDDFMTSREEAIMSNLGEKIPLLGRFVRASNRAYTGFLTKLRADVFDDILNKNPKLADDPRFLDSLTNFVNSATGRGNLPKALERAMPVFNATIFSPRLMASRISLLRPDYYMRLQPQVRKEALKSLFSFVSTGLTVLGLAKMAGTEVGIDSRSADFGKIKVGNTRWDIWGGFQQYIKLISQLVQGELVSSTTGKVIKLGEGYKPITRLDIAQRFLESKASPITSFALQVFRGTSTIGEPLDITTLDPTKNAIAQRFIPMVIQDMIDAGREWGLKGIPATIPAIFGVGSQTYGGTPINSQEAEQQGALGVYKFAKSLRVDEANKYMDDLKKRKPTTFNKVAKFRAIEKLGLGQAEFNMIDARIANGERAGLIMQELDKRKTSQEKNHYLDDLWDLGIVNEKVDDQLFELKSKSEKKESILLPLTRQAFAEESNVLPIFRQPIAVEEESESSEPRDLVASAFPPEELENALAVMQGESGGDPNAINDNTNGSRDWGLFQINDVHAARIKEVFGYDMEELLDPVKNIEVAVWLWREQNWRPWVAAQKLGIV